VGSNVLWRRGENIPNAKKLRQLFILKHGASAQKSYPSHHVDEQNDDLDEGEQVDRQPVWLIHPSPVTDAALDFIFNNTSSGVYSPFSSELFKHVQTLKKTLPFFILGEVLYQVGNDFFSTETETIPGFADHEIRDYRIVEALEKAAKQKDIEDKSLLITRALADVDFDNRVRGLCDTFELALRYFLVFGVVPVTTVEATTRSTSPEHNDRVHLDSDPLRTIIDGYLTQIQVNLNYFHLVDPLTVRDNMLLTMKGDVYTCTDTESTNYLLWSFNDSCLSFIHGFSPRTFVVDMMGVEKQYTFAAEQQKKQVLDKVTKTNIIVSSEFSKEAEDVMNHIRGQTVMKPKDIVDQLEKDAAFLTEEEKKALALNLARNTTQAEKEMEDRDQETEAIIHRLNLVSQTVESNYKTSRCLNKYLFEKSTDEEDDFEQTHLSYYDDAVPSTSLPKRGSIHGRLLGGQVDNATRNQSNRIAQDEDRALENNALKKKLALANRFKDVLTQEVEVLLQNQAKTDQIVKMKQIKLDIMEKQNSSLKRDNESALKTNAKYSDVLSRIKVTVQTTLQASRISADEQSKLMTAFSDSTEVSLGTHTGQQEGVENIGEIVEWFLSTGGRMLANKQRKSAHHPGSNKFDFETMLHELHILVIPFFSGVKNVSSLRTYNHWLGYAWMHDKPSTFTNPGTQLVSTRSADGGVDEAGRRAITDTPELFMLDINPKTIQEAENTKAIIHSFDGRIVLNSVFQRSFLNVQFPSNGAVESVINEGLKRQWENGITLVLRLIPNSFTNNGQPLGPRVGTDCLLKFTVPFVKQYMGNIHNFLDTCNLVDSYISKTVDSGCFSKKRFIRTYLEE